MPLCTQNAPGAAGYSSCISWHVLTCLAAVQNSWAAAVGCACWPALLPARAVPRGSAGGSLSGLFRPQVAAIVVCVAAIALTQDPLHTHAQLR